MNTNILFNGYLVQVYLNKFLQTQNDRQIFIYDMYICKFNVCYLHILINHYYLDYY